MTDTIEFFSALFAPGDWLLIRPVETWTEVGRKRSRVDYDGIRYERLGLRDAAGDWQPYPEALKAAIAEARARAVSERTNLFFGVCPRLGPDAGWDKAWQIRTARVLWSDVDDCSPTEAVLRVQAAGLPAVSVLVSSGNGVHLYWLLMAPYLIPADPPLAVHTDWTDTPQGRRPREYLVDPGTRERLYLDARQNVPPLPQATVDLQDILAGIAAKIGGDHVQDLARLLRIPGSLNRKDERNGRAPQPCTLVELHPDRRYAIEEFLPYAEQSPDKERRAKIANMPLPKPKSGKKVASGERKGLENLIDASAAASRGLRSDADFALCCYAVEHGIPRDMVWDQVQRVGKFSEAGERYFLRTWESAEQHTRVKKYEKHQGKEKAKAATSEDELHTGPLTNARTEYADNEQITVPLTIQEVVTEISKRTGKWPRRVGTSLFVPDTHAGVYWLESPAATFAWLSHECGRVEWKRVDGTVSKEETYEELRRVSHVYDAVEHVPHEPTIAKHFYTCTHPDPGDGKSLEGLLDFFSLETDVDRQILAAMIATPLWGGDPGVRPAFMITAAAGRGKGKSKLCQLISKIFGGFIDVSPQEGIEKIKGRLLSPKAATKRIVLLDNVKSARFSWAELEALITTDVISGHQMYTGEGQRPNLLTWMVTLNGASLSTDMAQRTIEIKLDEPQYSDDWEESCKRFIDTRKEAILADLVAFLRRPRQKLAKYSRWALWESQVISRVEMPNECIKLILERQGEADVEEEEGHLLEDHFAKKLKWLDYEPDTTDVFIPSPIAARWYNAAMNENVKIPAATRAMKQMANEGRLHLIKYHRSKNQRRFRWIGEHADSLSDTLPDLEERLAKKLQEEKNSDKESR